MAAEPYVGQIQAFGFSFAPVGWNLCDGSLLSIAQYTALYSLLGTIYGGDGVSTFAIPDLRGRVPLHMGNGLGLSQRTIGEASGVESVTLTPAQMPTHTHVLTTSGGKFMVSSQNGVSPTPDSTNSTIGAATDPNVTLVNNVYNNQQPDITLNTGGSAGTVTVSVAGGSQPFENMEPYLVINYCIALEGIFPSRS